MEEHPEIQENSVASKQSHYELFLKEASARGLPEEKLRLAFLFMESALTKGDGPDFKHFWEARKFCLEHFRESIAPGLRSELWNRFSELSKEGRRLKDIADEQSSFAAEQIGIAIMAITQELGNREHAVNAFEDLAEPQKSRALSAHWKEYNAMQKELSFLNAYATRINALRKELMKTDMRISVKNQFFEDLSKAGDLLFPRRKELIHEISKTFENDIDAFVHRHFTEAGSRVPIFALREEIKELQGLAKLLTLNAHAFNQTRMKLSACWDSLKEADAVKKKEFAEKKEIFQQNFTELSAKIAELQSGFSANTLSHVQAEEQLKTLILEMRKKELGRDEVKALKEMIEAVRDALYAAERELEAKRRQVEEERNAKKTALTNSLKEKAQALVETSAENNIEQLLEAQKLFLKELEESALNRSEKSAISKLIDPLKGIIKAKREAQLLALPADSRAALEQLNELLQEKLQERAEVKEILESLRKKSKSSSLDFNRALEFNDSIARENERLTELSGSIEELEQKIEHLEEKGLDS